jgi:hypothetical protein
MIFTFESIQENQATPIIDASSVSRWMLRRRTFSQCDNKRRRLATIFFSIEKISGYSGQVSAFLSIIIEQSDCKRIQ